jgi:TolA-binding protein
MRRFYILFILAAAVGFSCARGEKPENFYFGTYSEAEQLYNRAEYEKAIQKYQAYIDENPEGNLAIISQYYIARSYSALGRTEEARSIFEKIIKDHPDVIWANFSETQLKEMQSQSSPS